MWIRDPNAEAVRASLTPDAGSNTRGYGTDDDLLPLPDMDVPPGVTSLGRTIAVKGELTAGEHLIIEGRFEGRLVAPDHGIAIGRNAVVAADILARNVTVLGTAKGHVTASHGVELRQTASVEGEITSARVAIDEGAYFRGRVDPRRADAAVAVARHRMRQPPPTA